MASKLTAASIVKALCDSDCSEEGSDLSTENSDEMLDNSNKEMEVEVFSKEGSRPDFFEEVDGQQSEDEDSTAERSDEDWTSEISDEQRKEDSSNQSTVSDTPLLQTRSTRKRKRQSDKWKKTISKRRNSGRKYISSVNKMVSQHAGI